MASDKTPRLVDGWDEMGEAISWADARLRQTGRRRKESWERRAYRVHTQAYTLAHIRARTPARALVGFYKPSYFAHVEAMQPAALLSFWRCTIIAT